MQPCGGSKMITCPTCHRPFGGVKRFCFACRLPILRNHKWHVVGCYVTHDDCQNPTMRLLVEPEGRTEPISFPEEQHAAQEENPVG